MNKTLTILGMGLLTVACSDGGRTDPETDGSPKNPNLANPESSIVRQIQSSPLLDDGCANGGSVFEFGFDFNANGALDDAEVDSERTKILCHGEEGQVGYSAFQIWTMAGNEGSEADFLASLVGSNGISGDDGSSAYEIWLAAGNTGTEVDFLASLVGTEGNAGTDGLSAYEIWLAAGNAGSEADFLASLEGSDGNTGANGTDGSNGLSAPAITSSSFFYINENTQDSYTVTAFDADEGDELSFAIVGGEDAELFDINTETGIVSFKDSPDYEVPTDRDENNVYEIDLSVTDGTYTTTKALLVKVRNFEIIPAISTAGINSAPANEEYYIAGEIIVATVTFDYPISVVGSPQLALTMGDQVRIANYLPDDSNETILHFSYSVVAEDREGEGIRINENALSLNGSAIASTNLLDGLAASLMSEVVVTDQLVEDEAPVLIGSSTTSQFTQVIPDADADNQRAQEVVNTVLVDKDGDEDLDILYISKENQYAYWLINNGGTLNHLQNDNEEYPGKDSIIDAKDINGDTFADIVIVRGDLRPNGISALDNMSIYLSNELGELTEQVLNFPASDFSQGNVVIADMNGDGFDDIIVAAGRGATVDLGADLGLGEGEQDYGKRILIVLNDGNNVFTSTNVHYMGTSLSEAGSMLNVVDLDGDDLPEIIATSASGAKEVKLFKNTTEGVPAVLSFEEHGLGFNIDAMGKKSVSLYANDDTFLDLLFSGPRTELGTAEVADTGSLTLLTNTTTINPSGKSVITFTTSDFTDVPSSNGSLGTGDLDGDNIHDFAFKTLTSSAWYKGDGAGGFTKFNQSYFRTNNQAELSMGLSIGNLTGNDLEGNPLNEVVSALGHGEDKNDSTQACNWCLDIWQNTPSFDIEMFENTAIDTVLATFQADDVDSAVQFSLRGPDIEYFSIDESSGELSVIDTLLFEVPDDNAGDATIDEASNKNAAAGDNFYQLSIVISDGHNTVSTPITILVNEVIEEAAEEIIE